MPHKMKIENILEILKNNYKEDIRNAELLRDEGSCSYAVYGAKNKYFLKTIRHPFLETAISSANIQMYLLQNKFPTMPIILTKSGVPYVRAEEQGKEYFQSNQRLIAWRENWANICNEKFKEKRLDIRIDHRTLEAQGIDRIPTIHLGKEAHQLEKQGVRTTRGDINREIKRLNEERAMQRAKPQEKTPQRAETEKY